MRLRSGVDRVRYPNHPSRQDQRGCQEVRKPRQIGKLERPDILAATRAVLDPKVISNPGNRWPRISPSSTVNHLLVPML